MRAIPVTLVATALLVFGGRSMDASAVTKPLTLCTVATEVDLDPFKPIGDGTRHSILDLFTRDYLSEDPKFPGLLDAFNFSADGKTFTGRVASDVKWRDGAPLTSLEAALGIAKGLTHRPAHPNIRVLGTEQINEPGWETKTYTGIKILDARQFELVFDTSTLIANRVGVIRELLSSGELSNRLWPARLSEKTSPGQLPDVVSHYGVSGTKAHPVLNVLGYTLELHLGGKCKNADITNPFLPDTYTNLSDYDIAVGQRELVLEAYFNPERPGLKDSASRKELGAWLRYALSDESQSKYGVRIPSGHFVSDEGGYREGFEWPISKAIGPFKSQRKDITILLANKSFVSDPVVLKMNKLFEDQGIKTSFVYRGADLDKVDVLFQPASNQGKRQVWIEKALGTPLNAEFIKKYPQTMATVQEITTRSASTIPIDSAILRRFEEATFSESSIVPLFRYTTSNISKKSSPLERLQGPDGRTRIRPKQVRK